MVPQIMVPGGVGGGGGGGGGPVDDVQVPPIIKLEKIKFPETSGLSVEQAGESSQPIEPVQ
jgi:hypothetical protein